MATSSRDLVIKFLADTSSLEGAVKRAEGTMGKLKAAAVAVGGAFVATKAVQFLGSATAAAEADAKSQALLANQLKTTNAATNDQIASVERYINKLERQTGVMDDDLRPAYAQLARATGDTSEAQRELGLAMDIAAGKGVDLASVTNALEKAHNGNIGALGRLGIATKDAAGNTLTLEQAMDAAGKKFAGAAEAAITPSQRWKVATEELKESIGAHLLLVIGKLEEVGANLLAWFDSLSPNMQLAIEIAGGLAVGLLALAAATAILTPAIAALGAVLALATAPVTLIIVGVAALAAGLIYAYTHFQTFHDIVDGTITTVKEIVSGFVNWSKTTWEDWKGVIEGVWNAVSGIIKVQVDTVLAIVQPIIDLLQGKWGKAWDDFKTHIADAWEGIAQAIGGAISAIVIMLGNLGPAAARAAEDMVKALADVPGKILDALPAPIRIAAEGLGWASGVTPILKAAGGLKNLFTAEGGVFTQPTLRVIGEAGPEAVVPLSKIGSLGGDSGGGIVVNIANATFTAQTTSELYNQLVTLGRTQGGIAIPGGVRTVS